jgi:hypothetical protein
MNTLFNKTVGLLLLAVTLVTTSCRKDDFDTPLPGGADPDLFANITIEALKGGFDTLKFKTITHDWIIAGVVTADDRSGNFYKTVILQDSTAGIAVRIDVSDYYTKYPIGRRVFIKVKGLVMGDYNDLIQLGGFVDNSNPTSPSVEPIPFAQVSEHLFAGQYNIPLDPEVVTIPQLTANAASKLYYQNRFVRIDGVEFSDPSLTYADAQSPANRTLVDCDNNDLIVRSSNYATFAGFSLPNGNGSITGIFSVYGSDAQMYIRDTTDAIMDTTRCDGTSGGGGGVANLVSIASVRSLYTGSATSIGALKIRGVVISDNTSGNFNSQNITIQDSTGGVVVRFAAPHSFALNSEVEVILSGQKIGTYQGYLQISNNPTTGAGLPLDSASFIGPSTVTPRVATVADINANFSLWESTLVKVFNSTITSTNGNYGASSSPYPTVTLNDGTDNIILYTRGSASFSGNTVPSGIVSVTAIVVPFNTTKELMIRNTSDIQ